MKAKTYGIKNLVVNHLQLNMFSHKLFATKSISLVENSPFLTKMFSIACHLQLRWNWDFLIKKKNIGYSH
jgi:hypothetical protein